MKTLNILRLTIIAAVLSIFGCSSPQVDESSLQVEKIESKLLTISEYGDKYPFKIDSLTLMCKNGGRVVLWQKGTSNIWAVNGTALQIAPQKGWKSVKDEDIWNEKPLGFVVNEGLELCN